MGIVDRIKKESKLNPNDRYYLREKETLEIFLRDDKVDRYILNMVISKYSGRSNGLYSFNIIDSLVLIDSVYKTEDVQVKMKYINGLKKLIQSDNELEYYASLEYIYSHLLAEDNLNLSIRLDDKELFSLFKNSIKEKEDFLNNISFGKGEDYSNNLYGFVEDIERMFEDKLI